MTPSSRKEFFMFENIWFIAAVWMGLALVASLISIRTGISVALIAVLVGVIAGNVAVGLEGGTLHIGLAGTGVGGGHLHHILQSTEWTNFLALLGSGVLTFLAGAEIDPVSLKANWRASVLIGVLSFAIPFAVVWLFAQFVFGWPLHQAANRWHRAFHHLRRGRLRGDDRGRIRRHCHGQDDLGRLLHYGFRNRAGARDLVR